MTKNILNEQISDELQLHQQIHNSEVTLRHICGLDTSNMLSLEQICEIANPHDPDYAKMNLLEHFNKNPYDKRKFDIIKKLSNLKGYKDITYYEGICNILLEQFENTYSYFLSTLEDNNNGMIDIGDIPIYELFRLVFNYMVQPPVSEVLM